VGTVVYALAIGPLVQLLLPRFTVPEIRRPRAGKPGAAEDANVAGTREEGEQADAAVPAA
jgi:hypothetical protein